MNEPKPHFKEAAGVLGAFVVLLAFVAIGFLQMTAKLFFGAEVPIDGSWMAAMLSLASTSLGFLVGQDQPVDKLRRSLATIANVETASITTGAAPATAAATAAPDQG